MRNTKSPIWTHFKEWTIQVHKPVWDMVSVLWTLIPTLAGIVRYVIWAITAKPNSPLPIWSPIAIISGGILFLIFSFLAFHRVSTERDDYKKQLEDLQLKQNAKLNELKIEPDLKVYAKANKILPFNYDAKVFGSSDYFNGRQFSVNAILSPLKPMKIDLIEVKLCGKTYKANEQLNDYIKDSQSYQFTFDVPPEVTINTNDVKIIAWSNNQPYESNPFEINFDVSAK